MTPLLTTRLPREEAPASSIFLSMETGTAMKLFSGVAIHTTRSDAVLVSILLFFIIILFGIKLTGNSTDRLVVVKVDDKVVSEIELPADTLLSLNGPVGKSIIRIRQNKVGIESAPCLNKLCLKMGPVSRAGESIVCLPNKLLITIKTNEKPMFDAVTK